VAEVGIEMDYPNSQMVLALIGLAVCVLVLAIFWISGIRRLRRDLRGRAAGDTPFCTQCGYNLTGLRSEICPECGLPLTAESVRRGEARPRWIAVVDTVFFLLILLIVSLLMLGLAMP
jgi:hypothetical protein